MAKQLLSSYGGAIVSLLDWLNVLTSLLCSCILSQLSSQYPTFPMVVDVQQKSDLFDELAAKFEVPPLAAAVSA